MSNQIPHSYEHALYFFVPDLEWTNLVLHLAPDHLHMWPPADPYSLPSQTEIQDTKNEIEALENELIEAQAILDRLKTALFERRSYIAPIRRLPHDILSRLLLDLSDDDWKMPLRLQGVCRRWRGSLLDTPLAWTFLPITKYGKKYPSLVCLYMERSQQVPLHLSLVIRPHNRVKEKVMKSRERIACISLGPWGTGFLSRFKGTWSALAKLTFDFSGNVPNHTQTISLDMSAFPILRILHLYNTDCLLDSIATSPNPPALTELLVDCYNPGPLGTIVNRCKDTVIYMDLTYDSTRFTGPEWKTQVKFPELRILRLVNEAEDDENPRWYFNGLTPQLNALFLDGDVGCQQPDANKLGILGITRYCNLSPFPHLMFIHVDSGFNMVLDILNDIENVLESCPELKGIMYSLDPLNDGSREEAEEILQSHSDATGVDLGLTGPVQGHHIRAMLNYATKVFVLPRPMIKKRLMLSRATFMVHALPFN